MYRHPPDKNGLKKQAVKDAERTRALVENECAETGKEPPPYKLSELIGKGTFGRVYKASSIKSGQIVAVKIISIEEGDSLHPRAADTFRDILKEVNTLKLLNASGARNVNTIVDTLLVGQSVWMVTEYCAGGSVATMMRPTGGLAERWIIPILREVAEAIYWVHKQGIIHRDIKCANVLVTEVGGVQLCDFGVAGIIETKFDKRSTVTGTLNWMAPELFDSSVAYGMEVDIWAFGSMAYEIASGLPPNAKNSVGLAHFGSYLKQNCPRLEGSQYSRPLKDLVAFCMVQDPAARPPIEHVQNHPYIVNTGDEYPTRSLSRLVQAYRLWEMQGGARQSLFSAGGAQGHSTDSATSTSDEWIFDTLDQRQTADASDYLAVQEVYGPGLAPLSESTRPPRRRRPPQIRPVIAPLEKVFDPNTISNYGENARVFYGEPVFSDLPSREEPDNLAARESLIDLDASFDGDDLSRFVDLETIRAAPTSVPTGMARETDLAMEDRRQAREWKFPTMTPVAADQAGSSYPPANSHVPAAEAFNLGKPSIHPVDPGPQLNRASTLSLIDLDAGMSDSVPRPSTANSDNASISSGFPPFDLERHISEAGVGSSAYREPSIYVPDGIGILREPCVYDTDEAPGDRGSVEIHDVGKIVPDAAEHRTLVAPPLPQMPSTSTMLGASSAEELKDEFRRMIASLGEHLQYSLDTLASLPTTNQHGVNYS
ncbi:Serine/threonine-protein kinase PAK 5 [Sporothrix epigloea]|uniref:non-specific serine/threonine protein kinase n=1 Tax=Sporothrix epigloea TaxID=1892477 RepID=A0ABP0DQP9_9PEZI